MKSTSQLVVRSHSSGVPQRQFSAESIQLPVMCGAMVVCCMRYGVLDTNRLKVMTTKKSVVFNFSCFSL